jgi:hypothetical protein
LRALDRASNNSNPFSDSDALQQIDQRFPTNVLRVELERTLDEQLRLEVLAAERGRVFLAEPDDDDDDDDDDGEGGGGGSGADDAKKVQSKGGVGRGGGGASSASSGVSGGHVVVSGGSGSGSGGGRGGRGKGDGGGGGLTSPGRFGTKGRGLKAGGKSDDAVFEDEFFAAEPSRRRWRGGQSSGGRGPGTSSRTC